MINFLKKKGVVLGICLSIATFSFMTVNATASFASKSNQSFRKSYSGLVNIGGKTYYYSKKTGKKLTGYRIIGGKKYYFSTTSGAMLSGIRTVTINGERQTYYFLKKGDVFKGGLKEIGDKKYYFSKTTGKMLTGLRIVNNSKYYFDLDTGAAISGLKKINDKLYYYDEVTHKAITGFKEINNDTYYFHNKYNYALAGLQSFGDKLYYFNEESYKMLKNDTITYANIKFTFNNDGVSTKQSISEEFKEDTRTKLIFNGFKKLGTPYGTSDGEFRCNTFVDYCYKTIGIDNLQNLTSSRQAKYLLKNNKNIPFEDLKPGDLIFYNSENCNSVESTGSCGRVEVINGIRLHVHHVAIYIGEGKMLDSTQTISEGFGRVKVTDFNPNTTSKTYYPILYANLLD